MTVWLNRFSMCNALAMVDECQDYLVKFGIIMSEIGKMSTQQWKTLSNKNIAILNSESLLEIMKTSVVNDLSGRRPQWKMISLEDDLS
jgi:D-lyxose ketol-isomerase